jgi:signal transduction histidine kinase
VKSPPARVRSKTRALRLPRRAISLRLPRRTVPLRLPRRTVPPRPPRRTVPLRLPRRTIRLRLTAVYAILFLVSGAGLLAVTYMLVEDHIGPAKASVGGTRLQMTRGGPQAVGPGLFAPALPRPGGQVLCFAEAGASQIQVRVSTGECVKALQAQTLKLQAQVASERGDYLNSLLVGSGIALAAMTLAALGLGWLVSGRVLSPLRTITRTARNISASNLNERLALAGPDDELKELGDTVDGLLARLEGSFAAQRQFVANASHELRTPLARQRTLVEVALADPDRTVDSLEAACRRVLAAGQQQERLIEGLLTLARSQRGLDQFEPLDLAALTRETVLSRSPDAHQRDIKLEVVASPAVFPGDARLAERLITNLLDNAIRHNHAGGTVMVRTATASGQAALSVSNTGPVIHPAEVPGLFEPFRHRGTTRTSDGDSPGLGLSIVGAIAAAHGASVWVWAPPGGGLDIQVRFPCQPRLSAASATPAASAGTWGAPADASAGTPAASPGALAGTPAASPGASAGTPAASPGALAGTPAASPGALAGTPAASPGASAGTPAASPGASAGLGPEEHAGVGPGDPAGPVTADTSVPGLRVG